jgi:hypothetical protein
MRWNFFHMAADRMKLEIPMRRVFVIFLLLFLILGAAMALFVHPKAVQALPEYSSQTGEPCATCHLSPSGGGPRGPRGQGWVGSNKPGGVPSLVDSLELLGVQLEADPADFIAGTQPVPPAEALDFASGGTAPIHNWLRNFDGN